MNFLDAIKKAWGILKLNKKDILDVASKQEYTKYAFFIVVLVGVMAAIGSGKLLGIISMPIALLVEFIIGFSAVYFFARLLGAKGEALSLFRVVGCSYLVYWIAIVPFTLGKVLTGLASVWTLIVTIVVLRDVYKLSIGKAIATIVITIFVFGVIIALLMLVSGITFFSLLNR